MEDNKNILDRNKEAANEAANEAVSETANETASVNGAGAFEQTSSEQTGLIEFEQKTEAAETAGAAPEKAGKFDAAAWGAKTLTRKFAVIALAITVLVNAALTAGIAAAFSKNDTSDRSGMPGGGRPGSEMSSDENGKGGKMTPPGESSNSAQKKSDVSIGIVIKEDSGVYVAQVTGDNAKKAGFEEGDKIVSVDGTEIDSSETLISTVQSHKAGDTITVTVERDGEQIEIKTELE